MKVTPTNIMNGIIALSRQLSAPQSSTLNSNQLPFNTRIRLIIPNMPEKKFTRKQIPETIRTNFIQLDPDEIWFGMDIIFEVRLKKS